MGSDVFIKAIQNDTGTQHVTVVWGGSADGSVSTYPASWLRRNSYSDEALGVASDTRRPSAILDASSKVPSIDIDELTEKAGILEWLWKMRPVWIMRCKGHAR